jgi:pimeloyl-ACP methyl ester carboxylesterase
MASALAADGARIEFAEHGDADAPALLLVHGITESREGWAPIVPALAERWRVIAVDLRGHGQSERREPYDPVTLATDLDAVVRTLELEAPLLVGHSLGGVVVSAYAGLGFAARGIVDVDQPLALGGFKDALEPLAPMLRGDSEAFAGAIAIVFSVLDGPLPAAERARLDALSSPEQEVVLGVWGPVLDSEPEVLDALVASLLAGIRVPMLSLHGTDPGSEYTGWLLGQVPTAVVELWPDSGHYPHLVDPARFVARIHEFDAGLAQEGRVGL